jgi:hypothetical protein
MRNLRKGGAKRVQILATLILNAFDALTSKHHLREGGCFRFPDVYRLDPVLLPPVHSQRDAGEFLELDMIATN